MLRVYLGGELLRCVYLDESGTTERATFLSVAGVIIDQVRKPSGGGPRIIAQSISTRLP